MAYTIEQYNNLRAAIATGAASVTHDGETVTFRSAAEMRALAATMERELGLRPSRRRSHVVGF